MGSAGFSGVRTADWSLPDFSRQHHVVPEYGWLGVGDSNVAKLIPLLIADLRRIG